MSCCQFSVTHCANSKVPVFDATSLYGSMSDMDIKHSLDRFVAVCTRNNRWVGEVPSGSLVGVIGAPTKQPHQDHVDIGFNLMAVAVLATPFNTRKA